MVGVREQARPRRGHCTGLTSFADVTAGRRATAQYAVGLQAVDLDTIVGSVGKAQDFDCGFRPGPTVDERRWLGDRQGAALR